MSLDTATKWLWLVPIGAGLLATAAYFAQGGFGGGHGRLDPVIFILGCPAILLLGKVPTPSLIERYDLVLVIWCPAFINALILAASGRILRHLA